MKKIIKYLESQDILLSEKQESKLEDIIMDVNMQYAYDMHDPT